MRKASILWTIAILGFIIFWATAGRAQVTPSAKPAAEEKTTNEPPNHAYRLDFSVNELEDGKKLNTRQYSLNLNGGEANELKIGSRVPVQINSNSFEYIDVGTSIWGRLGEQRSDGISLAVRAEISNFATPEAEHDHDARPIIRQLQIKAGTLAQLGKPMVVGSVDDPNSKRQFQLEVTVTKLK
jgi:hypothetical protein